jgi:hypothetical protein
VSNDFLDKNPLIVEKVQECLAISIKELLLLENLPARIARMYKLPISEVNQWLETIEWERNGTIDKEIIESVQKVLSDLQLINSVTK